MSAFGNEERKNETHPSFGMARLTRVNGPEKLLFGSSVKPSSWVELQIARGVKEHGLGRDWYYRDVELVEIQFSPAQFAELITTFNCGSGVPCTISEMPDGTHGKKVKCFEEGDESQETRQVIEKIREYGDKISAPLDSFLGTIDQIIADKKISQKLGTEIKGHFARMNQDLKSNLPFYISQLDEAASKVVSSKKAEIDAFMTTTMVKLGLQKFEELKQIGGNDEQHTQKISTDQ